MQIYSKPLLAFLLDPLRRHPRSMELTADPLKITGRQESEISLDLMPSAPMVMSKGPVTTLVLSTGPVSHNRLARCRRRCWRAL